MMEPTHTDKHPHGGNVDIASRNVHHANGVIRETRMNQVGMQASQVFEEVDRAAMHTGGASAELEIRTKPTTTHVRVGRLPGKVVEVDIPGTPTVAAALQQAGVNPTGYEIRVNGQPEGLNKVLKENDSVVLIRPVQGNTFTGIEAMG